MTQTITTIGGWQITDLTVQFVEVEDNGTHIWTDIITHAGRTAGPCFRKAEWRKLQRVQKARQQYAYQMARQTRWYKASKYALVNRTETEAKIRQMTRWMNEAQQRMLKAEETLRSYGIEKY